MSEDIIKKEDIFNKEYLPMSDSAYIEISQFKDKAQNLHDLMEMKNTREFAIAKTKLEECVMWFTKGISNQYK